MENKVATTSQHKTFTCNCGEVLTFSSKYHHLRSRKHFKTLENNKEKEDYKKIKERLSLYMDLNTKLNLLISNN